MPVPGPTLAPHPHSPYQQNECTSENKCPLMNFTAVHLSFVYEISTIKIKLLEPLLNNLNWRSSNLYLY